MQAHRLTHFFGSQSRVRRLAAVGLPVVAIVACNGILGIEKPRERPGETAGRGGNAGAQGEPGGEGGDGTGGSGASPEGGTGGTRPTGGNASGGAGRGGDAGGSASGGIQGGASGAGVAGTRPEGGESGAGEAGIGGTAGAGAGGTAGAGTGGSAGAGAGGDAGAGAGGDGGAGGDDSTGGCDPTAPFGPMVRLPINDDKPRIFFARLTDDELTIVFQDINFDIWIADRANTTDDFRNPKMIVSTGYEEWAPTLSGDGLTLFFQRNLTNLWTIFVATRERRSDNFSLPSQVLSLDHTAAPYFVPNGEAMYLSWDQTRFSVFRAERRAGSFVFGERIELTELGAGGVATYPVVSADELTIYFGSNRTGGLGYNDVYRARRSRREDPFGEPVHVSEFNSSDEELVNWISRDHCTVYMHRRLVGVGEVLYTAKRSQ